MGQDALDRTLIIDFPFNLPLMPLKNIFK